MLPIYSDFLKFADLMVVKFYASVILLCISSVETEHCFICLLEIHTFSRRSHLTLSFCTHFLLVCKRNFTNKVKQVRRTLFKTVATEERD